MKILIADDHTLLADSLQTLLEANGYEVVATVANGVDALAAAERWLPEIALIDVEMPVMNGIEATRLITERCPETTVVMISGSDDEKLLFAALEAGARGFLLKDLEPSRLLTLIEGAARGELALSPRLVHHALIYLSRRGSHTDPDALTEREREVLRLMTEGTTSNRRLSKALHVSENTVKFHVRNILDKLHLHNRAQAVGYALRHQMVPLAGSALDPTDRQS
jgi:DNA-binding NarL/FixJ family response regulator